MLYRLVSPMRRPGSANAHFVKRIPADLKAQLIGREFLVPLDGESVSVRIGPKTQAIRFSLQTGIPSEVKIRQAHAAAFFEEIFASLRENRPIHLSREQIAALAGELYRAWAREVDDRDTILLVKEDGKMVRSQDYDSEIDEIMQAGLELQASRFGEMQGANREDLEKAIGPIADHLLTSKKIMQIDDWTRGRLLSELSRALSEGMRAQAKRVSGDFRPDDTASRFPSWTPPEEQSVAQKKSAAAPSSVSLTGLVDMWWVEAKAAGKSESTFESYSNSFRLLSSFLGHDDATHVTPEDIIKFKDHRLTTPNPKTGKAVSAKTVKASDLTAFKSIFEWAAANRKLPSNPATGITVKLGKKPKLRERDFTNDEASAILSAASAFTDKKTLSETDAMKRWVPWLCAYTGARVGEMVQLRKEDIRTEDGHWIITITPEAGTVKGKERRDVPVHAHLVEMGFIEFVKTHRDGYLFITIKPGKSFAGTLQGKKNRLAEFARQIVKDPNVAPNHGWRHTFKTRGIEAGIQEKVLDAICGHAPATVGRTYGSVSLKTKIDAMVQFPRYKLNRSPAIDPTLLVEQSS